MKDIKKLDIGCGAVCAEDFTPWDIKDGRFAHDLSAIADGQLDAIKASHVLEHISFRKSLEVLREWARALRIGGELFIAVPDFDLIVKSYVEGADDPVEMWTVGGQKDEHDQHLSIWNRRKLVEALGIAGLEVVGDWKSKQHDCSHAKCSLNFRAIKRGFRIMVPEPMKDCTIVMSVPRLGFLDNMACVHEAAFRLELGYHRANGAFWGQCLERGIMDAVESGRYQYILTVDYDSVFTANDVLILRDIMDRHQLDVLAPLQIGRNRDSILALLDDGEGKALQQLDPARLDEDWWPIISGHFGLTMIRVESLKKLPHPWFLGVPNDKGEWGEGRIDDDIFFWRLARQHGLKCAMTPQVRIGHMQLVCTWPSRDLSPAYQYINDYSKEGRPAW
jgi:predicted SAM-dependent methyltransferase